MVTLSRRDVVALGSVAAVGSALALRGWFRASPIGAAEAAVLRGAAFGTTFQLQVPASAMVEGQDRGGTLQAQQVPAGTLSAIKPSSLSDAIEQRLLSAIAMVDRQMSPYRADSDLTRFNRTRSTDLQPLPSETRSVLAAALTVAQQSNGAFDPTVGPWVARYGFGPIVDAEPGHYSQLQLADLGVRKDAPALSIDLCGIAKGYALDAIAAELDALGVAHYLLEIGGEVLARGAHPQGRLWQVAIDRPSAAPSAEQQVGAAPPTEQHMLALPHGFSVATSGDTQQFYELDGQRYTHVIDPRTGQPVNGSIASVSVLAHQAMYADAWATALMVLGLDAGVALAQSRGLDTLFLARDGRDFATVVTGRFGDLLLS